jgi:hypothetical protein
MKTSNNPYGWKAPVQLTLGAEYFVSIFGRTMKCRFIQPTEKGFNFLNLDSSKCVLKHHIYPTKKYPDKMMFFLQGYLSVWGEDKSRIIAN